MLAGVASLWRILLALARSVPAKAVADLVVMCLVVCLSVCVLIVQARMQGGSYVESVSLAVPMYSGEQQAAVGARRPNRLALVGGALAVLACSALILSAFTPAPETELDSKPLPKITPKFVDWKKEDAGSDDMNLHLKVAETLAKADGLAEKNLSPVPEKLLREAQQAAEEQRSMPGLDDDGSSSSAKKPKIPASLEKMFMQAEAEQKVEKLAKEGDRKRDEEAKDKKAAVKAAASKKKAEMSASMKLLKQVSQDASSSSKTLAKASSKK